MRLPAGTKAIPFDLPAINGSRYSLGEAAGKPLLLSFYRFATCPFCNLRLHQLVTRSEELGSDFGIVAIFDSPLDHLREKATGHQASFPILADPGHKVYRAYGIENSVSGVIRGMILRMPTLLKAMFVNGYIPTTIKGRLTTMPADFLIDSEGVIRRAHYGADEGDHLPFDEIRRFALEGST